MNDNSHTCMSKILDEIDLRLLRCRHKYKTIYPYLIFHDKNIVITITLPSKMKIYGFST